MTLLPATMPIVVAPMAGGPTTPALVVAAAEAGALGFLAGGGLTPAALERDLAEVQGGTGRPYGVNLFLPSPSTADPTRLRAYAERLAPLAAAAGVALGEPQWDDDDIEAKLDVVIRHRPAAVSFTFGLPTERMCEAVRGAGAPVLATVTTVAEAEEATERGVDAVVAQGAEAGGHRGAFRDDGISVGGGELVGRVDLLRGIREVTTVPVLAAGGITSGAQIAEALRLGAVSAVLGTAFLCCPEAGTPQAHRRALLSGRYRDTVVTRAFTGRPARGLRNEFAQRFDEFAPAGYPEVHRLTRPLRAAAAAAADPANLHLWAGTGWQAVTAEPAATVVARLERERVAAQ